MKKWNMLSIIRKKDPYSKMRKATQEHSIVQNILKREFQWFLPFKKLWTDISYLKYKGKWIYLSVIKDMVSWEVLSNQIADNLELTLVQDSLKDLEHLHLEWAIIHSDQWFHYTHPSFSLWIKRIGCIQSMSRRWNCIDNAPTESFFGHMKDEIDISWCNTLEEVKMYIDNYIFEYNNERPQWHRKKMTPVQYRNHLLTLTS
jgi:transposase InsO family protein